MDPLAMVQRRGGDKSGSFAGAARDPLGKTPRHSGRSGRADGGRDRERGRGTESRSAARGAPVDAHEPAPPSAERPRARKATGRKMCPPPRQSTKPSRARDDSRAAGPGVASDTAPGPPRGNPGTALGAAAPARAAEKAERSTASKDRSSRVAGELAKAAALQKLGSRSTPPNATARLTPLTRGAGGRGRGVRAGKRGTPLCACHMRLAARSVAGPFSAACAARRSWQTLWKSPLAWREEPHGPCG